MSPKELPTQNSCGSRSYTNTAKARKNREFGLLSLGKTRIGALESQCIALSQQSQQKSRNYKTPKAMSAPI
jgi:hypothetical protein